MTKESQRMEGRQDSIMRGGDTKRCVQPREARIHESEGATAATGEAKKVGTAEEVETAANTHVAGVIHREVSEDRRAEEEQKKQSQRKSAQARVCTLANSTRGESPSPDPV